MAPYPNDQNEEDIEDVEEIGLDPSPETAAAPDQPKPSSTSVGLGGYNVDIDNRALPYVGIVVSAMILLISITVPSGKNQNQGYGIAVTIISMILGLVGAYMVTMNTALYDTPLTTVPLLGAVTWGNGLAQFIFIWNLIAAGILTFDGPFVITSNGYFACWGGVVFGLLAVGVTTDTVRTHAGNLGIVNGLLIASIIQICAVIPEMDEFYSGPATYSLVICILTVVAILAFGAYPAAEKLKFPFFALFSIFWIVLACFVTFKGPFLATGNGYFSAWMGCVLCLMAAGSSMS